jgi:hypothetical protein
MKLSSGMIDLYINKMASSLPFGLHIPPILDSPNIEDTSEYITHQLMHSPRTGRLIKSNNSSLSLSLTLLLLLRPLLLFRAGSSSRLLRLV